GADVFTDVEISPYAVANAPVGRGRAASSRLRKRRVRNQTPIPGRVPVGRSSVGPRRVYGSGSVVSLPRVEIVGRRAGQAAPGWPSCPCRCTVHLLLAGLGSSVEDAGSSAASVVELRLLTVSYLARKRGTT
ncbi:unnamed protein product, partial [Polarella glacialis]